MWSDLIRGQLSRILKKKEKQTCIPFGPQPCLGLNLKEIYTQGCSSHHLSSRKGWKCRKGDSPAFLQRPGTWALSLSQTDVFNHVTYSGDIRNGYAGLCWPTKMSLILDCIKKFFFKPRPWYGFTSVKLCVHTAGGKVLFAAGSEGGRSCSCLERYPVGPSVWKEGQGKKTAPCVIPSVWNGRIGESTEIGRLVVSRIWRRGGWRMTANGYGVCAGIRQWGWSHSLVNWLQTTEWYTIRFCSMWKISQ